MNLITKIKKHRSVSIVGLAKNAGKTEVLNYLLASLRDSGRRVAVTSIGVDGESYDITNKAPKPRITIYEGMIFITSEVHYRQKRFLAEIIDVSSEETALGRLVMARALQRGTILLSGPADTVSLKRLIRSLDRFGVDLTLVDGAVSRLSPASPVVTEALVLATGAAVSGNMNTLVKTTRYACDLIAIEQAEESLRQKLIPIEKGVWAVDDQGEIHDLHIPSVFMLEQSKEDIYRYGSCLFVSGAVSDVLLRKLSLQKQIGQTRLIVRDFTKIFASAPVFHAYLRQGGTIEVLYKSTLLAVSINPKSPEGYSFDSEELQNAMQKAVSVPVYDVKRI